MTLDQLQKLAAEMDRDDQLGSYHDRFHIPQHAGRDAVYFCGNSLGLMPKGAAESVERELRAWRDLGVEGHFKRGRPWVSFHELFTNHLAAIVGGLPHEVVAMNTLTVNLHLMLTSFYGWAPDRHKVLIGHSAFPSDRYAIESQIVRNGLELKQSLVMISPRAGEATLRTEDVVESIEQNKNELELVLMDGVNYYTGEFLDIPAITEAAHRHGIIAGFDLAHAAGNVPLHLHDWGVDFAVWCSYKYLNGGPGCPAGCFVHERHATTDRPRLAGWWGHDKATRFAMGPNFAPIPGAEGWQLSNPPLFSLAALLPSLELFSEIGMDKLRAKSEALTGFLDSALRELYTREIEILTPADPARRGCQLSLRIRQEAKATFAKLQEEGIVCDWREPDVIRLAPVPLYNRFADVVRCVEVFAECSMREVTLVGGGLAGALLALMLARKGIKVTVYERRTDLRAEVIEEGRSINLALSARGIHALSRVGLDGDVLARSIPMRGRFIHPVHGDSSLIPYGRKPEECIHSVSRRGLNAQLLDALAKEPNATVHFHHRCTGYNASKKTLSIRDESSGREFEVEAPVAIGTDGASSALRAGMMQTMRMNYSQDWLGHGYKELTIPPSHDGGYRMEPNALHIWPRGGFMMIALPNLDRTFTCTLFLSHEGATSFENLKTSGEVKTFFESTFPDAVELLPNLAEEFFRNPTGGLLTVRCSPWHLGGQALLLGDSAHAIVPFFGQGMNCAFEDCETLLDLFDECDGRWENIFPKLFARRKANADAIALMALDNFIEMRDTSADPRFALKRQLEHKLEEQFPGRFFSKYSMVSFHRFPYAEALVRGRVQDETLMEICMGKSSLAEIDIAATFARLQVGI